MIYWVYFFIMIVYNLYINNFWGVIKQYLFLFIYVYINVIFYLSVKILCRILIFEVKIVQLEFWGLLFKKNKYFIDKYYII